MRAELKTWGRRALIAAAVAWAGVVTWHSCVPSGSGVGRGLSGVDQSVMNGGGLKKVFTTGSSLSGSGTPANPLAATGTFASTFATTGVTAASALSSDTNNWDPQGGSSLSTTYVINEAPTANVTVTGLVAGASGQQVVVCNTASFFSLLLANESGSSTAGNRFTLPAAAGLLVGPGSCTPLRYNNGTSRWVPTTVAEAQQTNHAEGTHVEWIDEMLYQNAVVNAPLGSFLLANTSGTTTFNALAAAGRPGIFELTNATATTGRVTLQTSDNFIDFNSGTWDGEVTLGFPTLSTAADEYTLVTGFMDSGGARNQTDGCFIAYDRGNAMTNGTNTSNLDKFSCWCAQNATRTTFLMDGSTVSNESFTTVNAPVAALTLPNTNIYTLRVKMTGTTRAEFYVNGVKSCDINTNIPNSATRATGFMIGFFRGAATAARAVDIDRVRITGDLTSRRSP